MRKEHAVKFAPSGALSVSGKRTGEISHAINRQHGGFLERGYQKPGRDMSLVVFDSVELCFD